MARLTAAAASEAELELLPFAMNRLMAAWNRRLAARLAEHGASFAQWRVLMVAAGADQPLTIVDLSAQTLVPHSTLSRQLAAMEAEGLLARMPAADDGRAVSIGLTMRGRARYRALLPLAQAVTDTALAALSAAEAARLRVLIARLEAALEHDRR